MRRRWTILALALGIMSGPGAQAQEREWSFSASEDQVFLVFGVPESEDIGISFWCTQGSGEVKIFVADANEKLAPERFSVPARTMANELDATTSAEGAVPANSPLFEALSASDRFIVRVEGAEQTFPRTDADFAELSAACRRG
jgi:hypothetical protein